ncbi:pre-rRNA-processing protein TSR1 homolog [Gopherus evgoodei]|uniref:pre-rRNA-processing protein TSR1 homolog n=1 Tax=Gopherus evgoodei TaxID=1825980 RepID=UPI0011D01254|nr:pre-rRNA-processing protein TSR1 homolog [Gopherus evgoodei]
MAVHLGRQKPWPLLAGELLPGNSPCYGPCARLNQEWRPDPTSMGKQPRVLLIKSPDPLRSRQLPSTDKIIIKRLVLSGHPFKIFSKMAVVRYMFFNREDVLWFKLVELRTKWGRRGHITEPLGTHGHMKCHFDRQLKSQDTVLLNLHKRVFPKWTYDPHVPEPVPWVRNEQQLSVQEVEME